MMHIDDVRHREFLIAILFPFAQGNGNINTQDSLEKAIKDAGFIADAIVSANRKHEASKPK